MARAQQRLTDDTVIEETPQAGVFRRRRISCSSVGQMGR